MGRGYDADGPPTERAYVHRRCGGATVVSGDDFAELSNPFVWVSQTFCAGCGRHVGLGEVAWEDTGETLAEYRRRMRARAPASLTLWVYLVGPALATLIGAGVGYLVDGRPSRGPFVGGVVGLLLGGGFIAPRFARFWGIDYRVVDRRRTRRPRRPAADELEPVALAAGPDQDDEPTPAPESFVVTLHARCPHCRTVQAVSGPPPSIAYTCSGCGRGALVPVPAALAPAPAPKPAPPAVRRPRPRWDDPDDDRPARRRRPRPPSMAAPVVLLSSSVLLIAAGGVLAVRMSRSKPAPPATAPAAGAAAVEFAAAPAPPQVGPAPPVPFPLPPAAPKPADPAAPAPKADPAPPPADLAAGAGWDGRVYLALLPEFDVKNGPWPYAKDGTTGSPDRKPISVGGEKARHGLGMHPPTGGFGHAGVKFRIGRRPVRLEAGVALNDTADEKPAPAVFEVWGDGKRLWQSPPVAERGVPVPCRVDLSGVDVLELRVSTGWHIGVHAVWVDPRLVPADEIDVAGP